MHKLRLTKGLSYNGVVKATKEQPEVLIQEESIYQSVMASGYFEEVAIPSEDNQHEEKNKLHHSLGEVCNEPYGISERKEVGHEEYVSSGQEKAGHQGHEIVAQEEPTTQEAAAQEDISKSDKISVDSMDVEELKAYAALNGIDLSGQRKKADIIAAIKAGERKAAEARNTLRLA